MAKINLRSCHACGREKSHRDEQQWWWLTNYYGFRGYFCPACYNKIEHDANGNPRNPQELTFMSLKFLEHHE